MSKVPVQQSQSPLQSAQVSDKPLNVESLNIQGLDLNAIEHESPLMLKDEAQSNLLTASILQQFQSSNQINTIRAAYVGSPVIRKKSSVWIFVTVEIFQQQKNRLELYDESLGPIAKSFLEHKGKDLIDKEGFTSDLVEDVVQSLESYSVSDVGEQIIAQHNLQVSDKNVKKFARSFNRSN